MPHPSNRLAILGSAVMLLSMGIVAAGCSKTEEAPSINSSGMTNPPGGTAGAGGTASTGGGAVALFQANCANCHKMGEVGGGQAPNLSKMGAEHDAAWITDHIKDPKTHNQRSSMPSFAGKLGESDIKSLADHLASLK